MGKRSDFTRRKNDSYDTWDKRAIPPLLPFVAGKAFIDPCAGRGALVDQLTAAGLSCALASDLAPRRGDITQADALQQDFGPLAAAGGVVITNFPWTRALLNPLIEHCRLQIPTWCLLDSDYAFLKKEAPHMKFCKRVVAVGRLKWIEGSPYDAKDNCAWYQFIRVPTETTFYGR